MKKPIEAQPLSASDLITKRISELADWRGETLARMLALIKEAAPDVAEEWKWIGTPVWSRDGIICTGESYKDKVKLTFAKGAALKDPSGLFNASLDGNMRRAIDIFELDAVDAVAFKALIVEAVALNGASKLKAAKKVKDKTPLLTKRIPNKLTIETLAKSKRGEGVQRPNNAKNLFKQLGL